jgi:hypothetical protein
MLHLVGIVVVPELSIDPEAGVILPACASNASAI